MRKHISFSSHAILNTRLPALTWHGGAWHEPYPASSGDSELRPGRWLGLWLGSSSGQGIRSRAPGGPAAAAVIAVVAGIGVAAFVTIRVAGRKPVPVRGIRRRPQGRNLVWLGIGSFVVGGLGFAFGVVFVAYSSVIADIAAVIVILAALAIISVIMTWLFDVEAVPLDLRSAASPPAALKADRRTGAAVGATIAVVVGAVTGIMCAADGDASAVAALIAVVSLVTAWAISSFILAAWPAYAIAETYLSIRHRLPQPLMAFLEDAHRRGVLRQVGAVYQFRHIELQRRLANRDAQAVSDDE